MLSNSSSTYSRLETNILEATSLHLLHQRNQDRSPIKHHSRGQRHPSPSYACHKSTIPPLYLRDSSLYALARYASRLLLHVGIDARRAASQRRKRIISGRPPPAFFFPFCRGRGDASLLRPARKPHKGYRELSAACRCGPRPPPPFFLLFFHSFFAAAAAALRFFLACEKYKRRARSLIISSPRRRYYSRTARPRRACGLCVKCSLRA